MPKLEVRSSANPAQLEVRERRLEHADGEEDRGEHESRQGSDYVGDPEREREQTDRRNHQPRANRPRQVEPVGTINARVEVRKVHAINAREACLRPA